MGNRGSNKQTNKQINARTQSTMGKHNQKDRELIGEWQTGGNEMQMKEIYRLKKQWGQGRQSKKEVK